MRSLRAEQKGNFPFKLWKEEKGTAWSEKANSPFLYGWLMCCSAVRRHWSTAALSCRTMVLLTFPRKVCRKTFPCLRSTQQQHPHLLPQELIFTPKVRFYCSPACKLSSWHHCPLHLKHNIQYIRNKPYTQEFHCSKTELSWAFRPQIPYLLHTLRKHNFFTPSPHTLTVRSTGKPQWARALLPAPVGTGGQRWVMALPAEPTETRTRRSFSGGLMESWQEAWDSHSAHCYTCVQLVAG